MINDGIFQIKALCTLQGITGTLKIYAAQSDHQEIPYLLR